MKLRRMNATPHAFRELRLALLLVALVGSASACVTDPADPADGGGDEPLSLEQRIEVLADCTPTDLQVLVPWTGPAFDPATGALLEPLPAGHVEAVVNGWYVRSEEAAALRMEQATKVVGDVLARDGLLGFEAVESIECDIGISHTLWRDEAAMFAFVTGAPHAEAMALASRMHHEAAGAHWVGEARSEAPSWQEGIDRYVEELRERGD